MEDFSFCHTLTKPSDRSSLFLHDHESFELFWFLDGDVDYIVEGNVYPLKPYEMIIIPPRVLHRAVQKSPVRYERMILNINQNFFDRYHCSQYKKALYRTNPKIDADQVFASGLSQLLERIKKYTKNFSESSLPVLLAVALEALHILNGIDDNSTEEGSENNIQKIILYINQHFTEKFSLDHLAETIYLSKGHMCRSFKKATGYTLSSYMNHVRINHVKELYQNGMSLSEASMKSGFGSYVHFYKAFCKENGVAPREGLK